MSHYGTVPHLDLGFTVQKRRLLANQIFRFGGADLVLGYRFPLDTTDSTPVSIAKDSSAPSIDVVNTGNTDVVTVVVTSTALSSNKKFNNPQIVDIVASHTVPANVNCVVLEGSFKDGELLISSDFNIPAFIKDSETELIGSGKILTFTLSE